MNKPTYFFAPSTMGFYTREISGQDIPNDAVQLQGNDYETIMSAAAMGKTILVDSKGYPYAADMPLPKEPEMAELMRGERDRRLLLTVDTMNPMRWESLSDKEKGEWRDYRTALLNVPNQPGFPYEINWPEPPEAL